MLLKIRDENMLQNRGNISTDPANRYMQIAPGDRWINDRLASSV